MWKTWPLCSKGSASSLVPIWYASTRVTQPDPNMWFVLHVHNIELPMGLALSHVRWLCWEGERFKKRITFGLKHGQWVDDISDNTWGHSDPVILEFVIWGEDTGNNLAQKAQVRFPGRRWAKCHDQEWASAITWDHCIPYWRVWVQIRALLLIPDYY